MSFTMCITLLGITVISITGYQASMIYVKSRDLTQIVYFRNYEIVCPKTLISMYTYLDNDTLHIQCDNIEFIGYDDAEARRNPRINPTPSNQKIVLHDFNDEIIQFNSIEGFGRNASILSFDCFNNTINIVIYADIKLKKLVSRPDHVAAINPIIAESHVSTRLSYGRRSKLPGAGSKGAGNPNRKSALSLKHVVRFKNHRTQTPKKSRG